MKLLLRSGLLKDYYLTMSNIDRSDYYNIKFQKNPLCYGSGYPLFYFIGGFLRLFKNEKKIIKLLIIYIYNIFFIDTFYCLKKVQFMIRKI